MVEKETSFSKQTPEEAERRAQELPFIKAGGAPLEFVEEYTGMTDAEVKAMWEADLAQSEARPPEARERAKQILQNLREEISLNPRL